MQSQTKPISIALARELVLATARPDCEASANQQTVDLADAAGYVLAADVAADRDAPPFDRAMMDGYAINAADFASRPREFAYRVSGATIFAGTMPTRAVPAGNCQRIMTGAPMPPGTDCVIPIEDARVFKARTPDARVFKARSPDARVFKAGTPDIETVQFPGVENSDAVRAGRFVAGQGSDLRAGDLLLKSGTAIDGAAMNALASVGCARVPVRRPPRVVVLSTGDEIVSVAAPEIRAEQIRDSNYYALCAGLAAYRVDPPAHQIVPDDRAQLAEAVSGALTADLLILSGGVSMGDADFVPGVLAEAGIEKIFHRVHVKPGKPLWFGRGGPVVFGLPGNPVAVQVAWKIFIEGWLRAWLGLEPIEPWTLPLSAERRKRGDRPEFFPARLIAGNVAGGQSHSLRLEALPIHSSGHVSAAVGSSGFALQPGEREVIAAGDCVEFYPHGRPD